MPRRNVSWWCRLRRGSGCVVAYGQPARRGTVLASEFLWVASVGGMSEATSRVQLHRSATLATAVPYAYSATTSGPTRPIYLAGVCPLDASGVVVSPGDVAAQASQCLTNMHIALQEADAGRADVIYTRVLVATTDATDLGRAWSVVHEEFADHEVPSTLLGVTVLGWPGQVVELEVFAEVAVGG